ncbi:MAG: Ig-like domain-containing protein [Planctomycetaceae bacterium]
MRMFDWLNVLRQTRRTFRRDIRLRKREYQCWPSTIVSIEAMEPSVVLSATSSTSSVHMNSPLLSAVPVWEPDGNPLTVSLIGASPTHGDLTLFPNGSFLYTPNVNFIGTDSFSFQAFDGALDSNIATFTIDVTNSAPTAADSTVTVSRNSTLSSGVSASDPEGDSLFVSLFGLTTVNGTLTLNSDGSFSYSPALDFTDTDSFSFVASDGVTSDPRFTAIIGPVNTGFAFLQLDADGDGSFEILEPVTVSATDITNVVISPSGLTYGARFARARVMVIGLPGPIHSVGANLTETVAPNIQLLELHNAASVATPPMPPMPMPGTEAEVLPETAPNRLLGRLYGSGDDISFVTIQFNHDSNPLTIEGFATSNQDGVFVYDPEGLPHTSATVWARSVVIDQITGLENYGGWASVTFTPESRQVANVDTLTLLDDSDHDGASRRPEVTGQIAGGAAAAADLNSAVNDANDDRQDAIQTAIDSFTTILSNATGLYNSSLITVQTVLTSELAAWTGDITSIPTATSGWQDLPASLEWDDPADTPPADSMYDIPEANVPAPQFELDPMFRQQSNVGQAQYADAVRTANSNLRREERDARNRFEAVIANAENQYEDAVMAAQHQQAATLKNYDSTQLQVVLDAIVQILSGVADPLMQSIAIEQAKLALLPVDTDYAAQRYAAVAQYGIDAAAATTVAAQKAALHKLPGRTSEVLCPRQRRPLEGELPDRRSEAVRNAPRDGGAELRQGSGRCAT